MERASVGVGGRRQVKVLEALSALFVLRGVVVAQLPEAVEAGLFQLHYNLVQLLGVSCRHLLGLEQGVDASSELLEYMWISCCGRCVAPWYMFCVRVFCLATASIKFNGANLNPFEKRLCCSG